MFEPLALAYTEHCRENLVRGDYSTNHALTLEGMLPKFKRGEMVEIETPEYLALSCEVSGAGSMVVTRRTKPCST